MKKPFKTVNSSSTTTVLIYRQVHPDELDSKCEVGENPGADPWRSFGGPSVTDDESMDQRGVLSIASCKSMSCQPATSRVLRDKKGSQTTEGLLWEVLTALRWDRQGHVQWRRGCIWNVNKKVNKSLPTNVVESRFGPQWLVGMRG